MLRFIILELLSTRPLTGYEIAKRFRSSLIFVWGVHHTQIYSQLRRLEREGLLTSRVEVQQSRPNRRVYQLTEAGRKVLIEWLQTPPDYFSLKDPMLLKSFAFDLIPPDQAIAQLRDQLRVHQQKLDYCRSLKAELQRKYGPIDDGRDRTLLCRTLPLEHLIRYESMYVEWCRWAIGRLHSAAGKARPRKGGTGAPPPRKDLDNL